MTVWSLTLPHCCCWNRKLCRCWCIPRLIVLLLYLLDVFRLLLEVYSEFWFQVSKKAPSRRAFFWYHYPSIRLSAFEFPTRRFSNSPKKYKKPLISYEISGNLCCRNTIDANVNALYYSAALVSVFTRNLNTNHINKIFTAKRPQANEEHTW